MFTIHVILTPHSRTSSVADPEYIRDAVLIHAMLVWKHLATYERIQQVALGPETIDVKVSLEDFGHHKGRGRKSGAETMMGVG